MKLVDQSGALVEVPEDQVPAAFASGRYGFQEGAPVPTVAPNGQVGTVAPEKMAAFLAGGGRVVGEDEYRKAQLDAKYGGIGGTLAAGGEGAARGITLGLSDPLAVGAARLFGGREAAEKTRKHLEEEKEAHPYVAGAGEIAGALAPIVVSGGAAAPEVAAAEGGAALGGEAAAGVDIARALGTGAKALGPASSAGVMAKIADGVSSLGALPRGVSGAGELAERAISGVLGSTAETAIGRAGQAAARAATRGIVEGGLFGAGQEISDATLQDRDLTAESLLASVGHGALMGGLLSGAAGGVGSLAREGLMGALGRAAPALDDAASEQAWKWLDPPKRLSEEAASRAGGTDAVGRTVFEKVLRPLVEEGGLAAAAVDNETKLALVGKALDNTGSQIGDLIRGNSQASVTIGDVLKPIDDRIAEFHGKLLGEDKVAQLEKLRASLLKSLAGKELGEAADAAAQASSPAASDVFGVEFDRGSVPPVKALNDQRISIADAIAKRRELQQQAYVESKALDPNMRVQLLRDISSEWSRLEVTALDDASPEGGEAVGQQLRSLNKEYQQLKIAESALQHNVARYATNRNLSLTDYMMGAAHAPSMLLAGHPLAAAGALASSVGHKALRAHGNAYAALLLDRLATWGGVGKAAAEVDSSIDGALGRFFSGARRTTRTLPAAASARTSDARFERERRRVEQLAQVSPSAASAHLAEHVAPLAMHAPDLARSFGAAATRATMFLSSRLPPKPPASPLTPQLDRRPVSAPDRAKFLRYVDAVEDGPAGALKKLAAGKLTREDVEVLRAVYPRSYQAIDAKVAAACAARKAPLGYQQRLQLGSLFGLPTDPSLKPEFVVSMQSSYITHPNSEHPPSANPQAKLGAADAARSIFSGASEASA